MPIDTMYVHRVNVERGTATHTVYGDGTVEWDTVELNLRCRIVPMRGDEVFNDGQLVTNITHRMFCKSDVAIAREDRVLFGERLFRVKAVINPDELDMFNRVELEEIRDGNWVD